MLKVLGVKIHPVSRKEAIEKLDAMLESKLPKIVCTINVEMIARAQKDREFEHILNKVSSLNLCDGFGVLWAAKFDSMWTPKNKHLDKIVIVFQWFLSMLTIPLFPNFYKSPIPEKISGSDFIWDISRLIASKKQRMFLLGGASTVAERAALKLQTEIYDLRICGVSSGSYGEPDKIIPVIKKSKADIIAVAFGAPKQERWLSQNIGRTGCKVGIGVGGTFDFLAGISRRAPKWMQNCGLEWLYRLSCNPSRIIRQLSLPKFVISALKERLRR